jgi:transposase
MFGRFEGLTDAKWELFRNIFPSEVHGGRGRPAAHLRNILNSLLYILIVGCRRRAAFRRCLNGHQKVQVIGGCPVLLRMRD